MSFDKGIKNGRTPIPTRLLTKRKVKKISLRFRYFFTSLPSILFPRFYRFVCLFKMFFICGHLGIYKQEMRCHEAVKVIFWNTVCECPSPIPEYHSTFTNFRFPLAFLAIKTSIVMSNSPAESPQKIPDLERKSAAKSATSSKAGGLTEVERLKAA